MSAEQVVNPPIVLGYVHALCGYFEHFGTILPEHSAMGAIFGEYLL